MKKLQINKERPVGKGRKYNFSTDLKLGLCAGDDAVVGKAGEPLAGAAHGDEGAVGIAAVESQERS